MADWVWTGTICCLYEKMGTDLFTKWRGKLSIQRSQTRSHESNSRARVREAVRSVDGKHLSVALPVSRTLWWAWLSTETSLPTSHIAQPMIFRVVFFCECNLHYNFSINKTNSRQSRSGQGKVANGDDTATFSEFISLREHPHDCVRWLPRPQAFFC